MFKQYGVVKPKSLDFILSFVFALTAICCVWTSIWLRLTDNLFVVTEAINLFVRAIKFDVFNSNIVVLIESCILYFGFLFTILFTLKTIFKREKNAVVGIIAFVMATTLLAFGSGFVAVMFEAKILPICIVFLAIFLLGYVALIKRIFKLEYAYLFKNAWLYNQYKSEVGFAKPETEENEEVETTEIIVEEPYEQKEEPVEENNDRFYFENSNGYDNYSYEKDFKDYNKQINEYVNEEKIEPEDEKIHKGDIDKLKLRKNNEFTFEQKLEKSFQIAKDYFKELKEYAEGLGFKSALTKPAETFSYKNTKYAMIDVAGQKGLKVYYKLDINDYVDSPIPLKDRSAVKKYENTPVLLVVKSELALKRAKKLFDDLKQKYEVVSDTDITKEEEQELEEILNEEDENAFANIKANNYSFEQKLRRAKPETRQHFKDLKNYFENLGFKSSLTKKAEIFTYKNTKYAMVTVAGQKGLKVYYKLNFNDYNDSPIPVKDMSSYKKYENTPVLLVAKSDLAIKRAKKLMDDVKNKLDKE